MTTYRIVRKKGYSGDLAPHKVEKRFLYIFWITAVGDHSYWTKHDCETYIKSRIAEANRLRDNPKDIVIAEYRVK